MLHGLEQFGVPGVEQFVPVTQTAEASPLAALICFMFFFFQFALTIIDKRRSIKEWDRPENRGYQSHMH